MGYRTVFYFIRIKNVHSLLSRHSSAGIRMFAAWPAKFSVNLCEKELEFLESTHKGKIKNILKEFSEDR